MGNFIQNLVQIVMTTIFILQVSAFNAELKYGSLQISDPTESEKQDHRNLKIESFRNSAGSLLQDARDVGSMPAWLVSLLLSVLERSDTLSRITVDLANFRGWFGEKK